MGAIGEAVGTGVVSNLARPGGNITGFAAVNVQLEAKRLELLKELLPNLSRVGMLANARIHCSTLRCVPSDLRPRRWA